MAEAAEPFRAGGAPATGSATDALSHITLSRASMADWPLLCAMEAAAYPADEAATPAKLQFRIQNAPELFWLLRGRVSGGPERIVGYACGTCTDAGVLTAESMSTHSPTGTTLCLHSVVIDAPFRRRGLARWMVTQYLKAVATAVPRISCTYLLAHSDKTRLYEQCGFVSRGVSSVDFGSEVWMEMCRAMSAADRQARLFHIDAFTVPVDAAAPSTTTGDATLPVTPLIPALRSGNAAAVIVLPVGAVVPETTSMQAIASHLNLPATAIVWPAATSIGSVSGDNDGKYHIRFFTPTTELPLCGHASIATAHALFHHDVLPPGVTQADLVTKDGLVVGLTRVLGDSATRAAACAYSLDLPAQVPEPVTQEDYSLHIAPHLASALGVQHAGSPVSGDNLAEMGVVFIGRTARDMLIVVTPAVFKTMEVNIEALAHLNTRIVSISTSAKSDPVLAVHSGEATADSSSVWKAGTSDTASDMGADGSVWMLASGHRLPVTASQYDCISRCFSPRTGTPEDPACGAAHCGIIPWWATHAHITRRLAAFQASERGGAMSGQYHGATTGRIDLVGHAETVAVAMTPWL